MKLIAENQQENRIIDRVCALLCDLGIMTDGYRQEEAIASTFFSAEDFLNNEAFRSMTPEERSAFFCSVEDTMRGAMRAAGHRTASMALQRAYTGLSHPDRHIR